MYASYNQNCCNPCQPCGCGSCQPCQTGCGFFGGCETFWIIVIIAVVLLWLHYDACGYGCGCGCTCGGQNGGCEHDCGCNCNPCC